MTADGCPDDVRQLFDDYALKLISAGFTRYSARAILHRIRWHYHVEKGDREFKCNNNWTPKLSRDFMIKHNQDGFFATRRSPYADGDENKSHHYGHQDEFEYD